MDGREGTVMPRRSYGWEGGGCDAQEVLDGGGGNCDVIPAVGSMRLMQESVRSDHAVHTFPSSLTTLVWVP